VTLADVLRETVAETDTKILTVDIERLPGLAEVWDQRTKFVPYHKFKVLPSMLCWAAKWADSPEVMFEAAWDDPAAMRTRLWDLFDLADIIVGWNSRRFDEKHIKEEWLIHGPHTPPAPWKSVDLMQVSRTHFGFVSHSLQHVTGLLGLEQKSGHYDAQRAAACMAGDAEAQAEMQTYNAGDVRITEQVLWRFLPWIHNFPHVAQVSSEDELRCNKCGSDDLERRGLYTANMIRYARYRCNVCLGWIRGARHSRVANTYGVK
jgi:hypothetical protein